MVPIPTIAFSEFLSPPFLSLLNVKVCSLACGLIHKGLLGFHNALNCEWNAQTHGRKLGAPFEENRGHFKG